MLPAVGYICKFFRYSFELRQVLSVAITFSALSGALVILNLVFRGAVESKVLCSALSLLPLIAVVTGFMLITRASEIPVIVCVLIYLGCCIFLSVQYEKPLVLKIVMMGLTGLLFSSLPYFWFLTFLFGNFGKNTVIQSIPSPSGSHYAQVIDSDQGALGGNTLVEVYEKSLIDNSFIRIQKEPRRVYSGKWLEYENMQIYWKDDSCLVINSVEYAI